MYNHILTYAYHKPNSSSWICGRCFCKKEDEAYLHYALEIYREYVMEVAPNTESCVYCEESLSNVSQHYVRRKRPTIPKQVMRYDNRRYNAAGKLIGSRNAEPWGWRRHTGKFYKNKLAKAERQLWNQYIKEYLCSIDTSENEPLYEPKLRDGSVATQNSNVNWRNL